ncbi:MAG: GTP-binding protein [bacterium]
MAIIVVAADDSVMPQTVESIGHAKESGVPIIIAITKIDKPGKNLENIKQDLAKYGLTPEDR